MKRFLGIFLSMLLFWTTLGSFIFCVYRLRDTLSATRQRLISIASNAALYLNARELLAVPLQADGDRLMAYQVVSDKLEKIKQANPSLKYVYVMMATEKPGILQYVVDADPAPQVITSRSPSSLPGDKYDARAFPEMLAAYSGPAADQRITRDEWGVFISGYAPIYDDAAKPVAILGVDIDAARLLTLQKSVRVSGWLSLVAFLVFLFSLFELIVFRSKNIV